LAERAVRQVSDAALAREVTDHLARADTTDRPARSARRGDLLAEKATRAAAKRLAVARTNGPSWGAFAALGVFVTGIGILVAWSRAAGVPHPASALAPATATATVAESVELSVAAPPSQSALASDLIAPQATELPVDRRASSAESAPPTAADAEASSAEPPLPPGQGIARTPAKPAGRRVFVDGRVIGQSPMVLRLSCGVHKFKIGSAGTERSAVVPCGGEMTLEP
jgi:hypothetical protein